MSDKLFDVRPDPNELSGRAARLTARQPRVRRGERPMSVSSARAIFARIDRDIAVAEARADRLLQRYGLT